MDKICAKCGESACDHLKMEAASQPSDKFLPKEDKGDIKDETVTAKPNPSPNPEVLKGPYDALEVPVDTVAFSLKPQPYASSGVSPHAYWEPAMAILGTVQHEHKAKSEATENLAYTPLPCTWKVGKSGLREVAYNFVESQSHQITVPGAFEGDSRTFSAHATVNRSVTLSKHIDDASAKQACDLYNEHLGFKK